MNQTFKSFLALAGLLSVANAAADCGTGCNTSATPTFIPRSDSVNAAREMVGWQQFINLCDRDCEFYGAFSITPEYLQSFRQGRLAECLLGIAGDCDTDCGETIKVSGSCVTNRGANDWLADYFGLPSDFESTLTFRPRIRKFLVDLNLYLGLDNVASGMWFRIHAPIVWTRWDLRFCENVINAGVNDAPEGYYNAGGVTRANLLNNATEFFSGAATPNLTDATFGDCTGTVVFNPLTAGRFASNGCDCKGLSETRLSDIEAALGWNFWCCDDYLIGLSIRASAPTANTPCADYFFSPVIGDGKHWKLGGGLNAQAIFWRSCDEDASFGIFLDARVQHLFKHCQTRTFDLCGKPNSRYMLAERLGTTRNIPALSGASDAGVEFQSEFAPVANLTRSNVDVKMKVEGDVAIKLAYMSPCWEFDLGYEFWGRSCEQICRCAPSADPLDGATWALKGDANVIGFLTTAEEDCRPVRLAATDSAATIHAGSNGCHSATDPNVNAEINNATLATARISPVPVFAASTGAGAVLQTNTSVDPVYLTAAAVDFGGTKGLSNKIFANLSYAWTDCECWTPFLGIGGEAEFASSNCSNGCSTDCGTGCATTTTTTTACNTGCSSSCDTGSCHRCALSQWGIWIKGGVAFN